MKSDEIEINGEAHITTPTAAKRLKISTRRVQQLIKSKRLPSVQFGREHFIKVSDLELVKERPTGRPKKTTAKAPVKRSTKKSSKKAKASKPVAEAKVESETDEEGD